MVAEVAVFKIPSGRRLGRQRARSDIAPEINESQCLSWRGSTTRGASLGLPPSPHQNLLGGLCSLSAFQGKFKSTLGEGTGSSRIYGDADRQPEG